MQSPRKKNPSLLVRSQTCTLVCLLPTINRTAAEDAEEEDTGLLAADNDAPQAMGSGKEACFCVVAVVFTYRCSQLMPIWRRLLQRRLPRWRHRAMATLNRPYDNLLRSRALITARSRTLLPPSMPTPLRQCSLLSVQMRTSLPRSPMLRSGARVDFIMDSSLTETRTTQSSSIPTLLRVSRCAARPIALSESTCPVSHATHRYPF